MRRAARYFYLVAFKIVISGRRDCVCRHGKGNFCLGLVVYSYAFQRPARKSLARFGCGCRYRNAVAVVRGRLVRRAAIDGYGVVDILELRGYGNVFGRHFKCGGCARFAVKHDVCAVARPLDKPFARRHFCNNVDIIAVFCRYALGRLAIRICRAAVDFYGIVDILVIRRSRDSVCRHCKGKFSLREIQSCGVDARYLPTTKLSARYFVCRYRNPVAVVRGRLVRRAARD